jgi:hypothetical protein
MRHAPEKPVDFVKSLPCWLALSAWLGASLPASAGESHGFMQVSASVAPRTSMVVQAPREWRVTTADRANGMMSAAEPTTIQVLSNTRNGLELEVQAPPGLFKSMHVRGQGIDAVLPGSGGSLAWRWTTRPTLSMPAVLELSFSFELDDSVTAGNHSWPVLVSGRALETAAALVSR